MGLKTFNVEEEVYKEYSKYCKEQGISMSKRVENFIRDEMHKIKSGKGPNKSDAKGLDKISNLSENSFRKYC